MKFTIQLPVYSDKVTDWDFKKDQQIKEWFESNEFEISFLPWRGMMIDLDDFVIGKPQNDIFEDIDTLGYVTIEEFLVKRNGLVFICK